MRRFFHRSFVFLLFVSVLNLLIVVGLSLSFSLGNGQEVEAGDREILIGITLLVALLLCLNITDILKFWILGKTKETKAKYIVGVPISKIFVQLSANINLLIFVSVAVGTAGAWIAGQFISRFITFHIAGQSVALALALDVLLLNAVSMPMIGNRLKQGITEIK